MGKISKERINNNKKKNAIGSKKYEKYEKISDLTNNRI